MGFQGNTDKYLYERKIIAKRDRLANQMAPFFLLLLEN